MAAGSVIARWPASSRSTAWAASARRCRSPSRCFVIGGLALAGVPPFSGFFSKDEILPVVGSRGGGWCGLLRRRLRRRVPDRDLHVADDLPRLLGRAGARGARARGGPPPPRRGHLQPGDRRGGGHRRRLPRPRAPHRRARAADEGRDGRARGAGASSAGCSRSPGVDRRGRRRSSSRRSPSSTLHARAHRRRSPRSASCSAPCSALAGIAIAYASGSCSPGDERTRPASASPSLHRLFVNKWYFDELIDLARRAAVRRGSGASASRPSSAWSSTGCFVGGTTGIVRAGSAAVRAAADRLPARLRGAARRSASSASPSTSCIQSS